MSRLPSHTALNLSGFWPALGLALLLHLVLLQLLPQRVTTPTQPPVARTWLTRDAPAGTGAAPLPKVPTAPTQASPAAPRPAPASPGGPQARPRLALPTVAPAPMPTLVAVAVPPPVLLTYAVRGETKGLAYVSQAVMQWWHDGTRYEAQLNMGTATQTRHRQTSVGNIGAQGLMPERFGDKLRGELAAHFEREKAQVSFSANVPAAALLPGAQDRLSVMLQLTALLAGDAQRYPPGSDIVLPVVSAREAEQWVFEVGPQEMLDLPLGRTPAIKLTRQPRREFDPRFDVWLGVAQRHLPVRWRLTLANGDFTDQFPAKQREP